MRQEPSRNPRLRFPFELREDESIPGAIARATRAHVLVHMLPVFRAAGVSMRHAGLTQIATSEEIRRVSGVIRCSADGLVERLGVRTVGTSAAITDVGFGELILPRAQVELRVRRIGPVSLRKADHHRLNWLNLLLPYCPESLELLVDRCPACGLPLGWHYAEGIGSCDFCGVEVPPAGEPPLRASAGEAYRFFSDMASLQPGRRASALERLPTSLKGVAPGTLVRLAVQLGGLVQKRVIVATSRHMVVELPPATLASIVSDGAKLLCSWPDGLRRWARDAADEVAADSEALGTLHARLKRLADPKRETREMVEVVTEALPGLGRHKAHAFSVDRRHYLYKDVQRRLGLAPLQMEALRSWPDLKFRRLARGIKRTGEFDAEQIDGLVPRFRNSVLINTCPGRFRLPLYAVEQLCRPGLLRWEDHPAVLLCRKQPSICEESVQALERRLLKAKRSTELPPGSISLSSATRRIGGRPKPWATIFQALVEGSLEFWLAHEEATAACIRVMPEDIVRFDRSSDKRLAATVPQSDWMSQLDASEVLNHPADRLVEVCNDLGFAFIPVGRSLALPRRSVLETASQVAFATEIRWHVGGSVAKVEAELAASGVLRVSAGWSRPDLIARSILPAPFSSAELASA